jgi:FMN phosphatase YigB (HAD superfamily)
MNHTTLRTAPFASRLLDTLGQPSLAGQPLAIYGLGVVARELAQLLSGYNVVGLMDKDAANAGKEYFGLTVLSESEAESCVKAIIIASSDVYWQTIRRRIRRLEIDHGITIVFPNGEVARPHSQFSSQLQNASQMDAGQLLSLIRKADIVSFDLFETLVTMQAFRSDDILEQAVYNLDSELGCGSGLAEARKAAEHRLISKYGTFHYDIGQIYDEMKDSFGIDPGVLLSLKDHELQLILELAVPRTAVVDLMHRCAELDKPCHIISDTCLDASSIQHILHKCGIPSVSGVWLSSLCGAAKAEGSLFDKFRDAQSQCNFLHIGDNSESDIMQAEKRGFSACKILSPSEDLLTSSLAALTDHARSASDGIAIGMVTSRLFNNPFSDASRGIECTIGDESTFGYIVLGPIIAAYIIWLIRQLERTRADRLLFFAREGFLLHQAYELTKECFCLDFLPEAIYFKTSRRMAAVAAIQNPQDALDLLNDSFSGTVAELLEIRFGVPCRWKNPQLAVVNSDEVAAESVMAQIDEILENAFTERIAYQHYMDDLGLGLANCIAVADYGIKGTIQHHLQRILGKRLDGFYVTGFVGLHNPYGMADNTSALLPQDPLPKAEIWNCYRYHLLAESVLTAPEGMYIKTLPGGRDFKNEAVGNNSIFPQKAAMQEGILAFLKELTGHCRNFGRLEVNKRMADIAFGLPFSESVSIANRIKNALLAEERYSAISLKRIWE